MAAAPAFTDVEAREHVRAYRRALAAGETPSAEVLAGVKAYRALLRQRSGQTPRARRSRKELATDVAATVADQVDPGSDWIVADGRAMRDLLAPYKPVISRRPTLPVLGGVRLATADDWLFLVGTDLERTLESRMHLEARPRPAEAVVPLTPLIDAVKAAIPKKRTAEALIRLRVGDGQLEVNSDLGGRRTIRLLDLFDFPKPPTSPPIATVAARKLDGDRFVDDALAAWLSAATDQTRPILNGALLEIDGDTLRWTATDSYRLTIRRASLRKGGKQQDLAITIQRDAVKLAAQLFKGAATVWITTDDVNGGVWLYDETRSLHVRAVEGDPPKYGQLIPGVDRDFAVRVDLLKQAGYRPLFVDRDRLAGFLASIPKGGRTEAVRLDVEASQVALTWREQDVADVTDTLEATWNGDPLAIQFNPGYLADGLASLAGDLTIWLNTSLKPALLTGVDTDGLYLLMPVRLP